MHLNISIMYMYMYVCPYSLRVLAILAPPHTCTCMSVLTPYECWLSSLPPTPVHVCLSLLLTSVGYPRSPPHLYMYVCPYSLRVLAILAPPHTCTCMSVLTPYECWLSSLPPTPVHVCLSLLLTSVGYPRSPPHLCVCRLSWRRPAK